MFTGVLKIARLPAPSCEEKIKINLDILNICCLAMDKTDACTGRVCLDLEQLQVMQGLNKAVVLYLSMNVNLGVFNVLSCLPKTTTGLSVGMSQC